MMLSKVRISRRGIVAESRCWIQMLNDHVQGWVIFRTSSYRFVGR